MFPISATYLECNYKQKQCTRATINATGFCEAQNNIMYKYCEYIYDLERLATTKKTKKHKSIVTNLFADTKLHTIRILILQKKNVSCYNYHSRHA